MSATQRMARISLSCLPQALGSSAGKEALSRKPRAGSQWHCPVTGVHFQRAPLVVCVRAGQRAFCVCPGDPSQRGSGRGPGEGDQGGAPGEGLGRGPRGAGVSRLPRCVWDARHGPGQGEPRRPAAGESRPVASSLSVSSGCACRWPPPRGASRPLALPQAPVSSGRCEAEAPAAPGQGGGRWWPHLSQETWAASRTQGRARSRDPAPSYALPPPVLSVNHAHVEHGMLPRPGRRVPQPPAALLSP